MIALLHHSIAKYATDSPEALAFRCRDQELSYQQLYKRSSQLANCLRCLELKSMDRVGIFMGKSIELPIATYGILSAGGAYVPIDPSSPQDRVEFILKDCGIEIVITSKSNLRLIQKIADSQKTSLRYIIGVSDSTINSIQAISWQSIEKQDPTPPTLNTQEDDLAYVIYTSGSTGVPKGLMHTHRSGLAYARYSASLYNVTSNDILGNHAPLHFDISTFEFLTGPYVGATSVLIPEEEIMFPASLAKFIEREQLTFWYSVPLALVQMLTRGDLTAVNLSSLRWILFAGEPIPPKYLAELVELIPNARFCNIYGPAEVNQCTYYHIPSDYKATDTPVPIGSMWDGARGLLVDSENQVILNGESGELLVASSTMMQGYWGREDLNSKAFYYEEPVLGFQRRYYRTGDIARRDENDVLHFLGRKDRQIKIRGYRLELDEVEAVLAAQSQVEEAAIILVIDQDDEKKLVAKITIRAGFDFDEKSITANIRNKLPVYGIPDRIDVLDIFPRTTSGKIDRIKLVDDHNSLPIV